MDGNVKRRIITEKDVRRVNNQRLDKLPPFNTFP